MRSVVTPSFFSKIAAKKRAGKLVDIDMGRVRRLVESLHTYLLKLGRDAGVDIRRG